MGVGVARFLLFAVLTLFSFGNVVFRFWSHEPLQWVFGCLSLAVTAYLALRAGYSWSAWRTERREARRNRR